MQTEYLEKMMEYFDPNEVENLQDCLFRAVDFIEVFFPSPTDKTKIVKLTDSQVDAIDSVQFGFPMRKHKFSEIERVPNGVVMVWPRQCTVAGTLVQLSDGTVKPIEEIENESVIAYKNGFYKSNSVQKINNGIKSCLKIKTRSGREIKCTHNHPFLTYKSYKQNISYINAEKISIGNKVAMARKLPEIGEEILSNEEVKFIAYMIAEGSLGIYNNVFNPVFTNTDKEIQKDFINSAGIVKQHKRKISFSVKGEERKNLLEKTKLKGSLSGDKFVPEVIFKSTTKQISIFLSKLIDCDGNVFNSKNHNPTIEYYSKSKKLIQDLSYLFTRIGMFGKIMTKPTYAGDNYRICFSSSISLKNAKKYLTLCSRKQKILDSIKTKGNDHLDTFPINRKIIDFYKTTGNTRREFEKNVGFKITYNNSCYSPQKLKKIKEKFPSFGFDENLYWDEVISIEDIGEQQTYGLTVSKYHTHITDGFVTHNTGKSFGCAYGASAFIIMLKNCNVGVVSASDDQSKKFMKKVKYIIKNSPFKDMIVHQTERQNYLELTNGNHIQCWPCSDSIEGSTYRFLFCDEAAKMDEDVLLESALPTVTHGDRWIMLSTPKGQKGKFIEYYNKGIESRPIICNKCGTRFPQAAFSPDIWPLDHVPMENMHQCPECGAMDYKYGIGMFAVPYVDPWNDGIRPKEKIKQMLDEHDWSPAAQQEYLGKIISEGALVFLRDWLEHCTNGSLRNVRKPKQGINYVIGADYGRKHDASAFYVTHQEGDKIILDYAMTVAGEFDEEREYYHIKKYLLKLIVVFNPMWIVPDATGLGDPLVETLENDIERLKNGETIVIYGSNGKVTKIKTSKQIQTEIYNNSEEKPNAYQDPKSRRKGFIISRSTKPGLIGNLIKLFQQGKIEIPPASEPEIDNLRRELLRFESEWKQGTNYTAYGTQSFHDDRVIALALSAWGHRRRPWNLHKVIPQGGAYEDVNIETGGWRIDEGFTI